MEGFNMDMSTAIISKSDYQKTLWIMENLSIIFDNITGQNLLKQ